MDDLTPTPESTGISACLPPVAGFTNNGHPNVLRDDGSGQLQVDQRPIWPPGRRRRADSLRENIALERPPSGRSSAYWRQRVCTGAAQRERRRHANRAGTAAKETGGIAAPSSRRIGALAFFGRCRPERQVDKWLLEALARADAPPNLCPQHRDPPPMQIIYASGTNRILRCGSGVGLAGKDYSRHIRLGSTQCRSRNDIAFRFRIRNCDTIITIDNVELHFVACECGTQGD